MKRTNLLGIVFAIILSTGIWTANANAQNGSFYDFNGYAGNVSTFGNTSTYRDNTGWIVGTATTMGNTTTYRDSFGHITGQSQTWGNNTNYYDSRGSYMGHSNSSFPNQTNYYGSNGQYQGHTQTFGNQTTGFSAFGSILGWFLGN